MLNISIRRLVRYTPKEVLASIDSLTYHLNRSLLTVNKLEKEPGKTADRSRAA
jgi:hypothetical protein